MKFSPVLSLLMVLALRSVATAQTAGPLTVTPAGGLSQSMPQGGPFAPASQTYTLTNTGTASLDFTVTKTQSWVTVLPSSGTLAAGATANVMVSMNGFAITLAAGTHTDTVTFTNSTNGSGTQTRPVTLTVTGAGNGALSVSSPSPWITSVGNPGGPFSPSSATFTLSNTGGSSINYAVTTDLPWLAASPSNGTLAGGATATVTVSIQAGANALAAGQYQNRVLFTNTTNGAGDTVVPWQLMISPAGVVMMVIPATPFNPSGPAGGPFSPNPTTYSITNYSSQPMTVSISKTQPWVDIAPSFHTLTLSVGQTANYQISINAQGNSLAPGTYTDTITFTNVTDGQNNTTRAVNLTVTPATGDTTAPTVVITSPAPPTATVTSNPATVGGTAADSVGVTSVSWANGRTGGTGAATGTSTWSASIPLAPGNNLITITARDAAGNAGSSTITLDFAPPAGDSVPPTVAIAVPTAAPTVDASASPISLGGTAGDNVSVSTVTWSNAATGSSGTATGTTTWTALVDLAPGANDITVTAFDSSGNSSTATLTVTLTSGVPLLGSGGKKKSDGSCGMGSTAPGSIGWLFGAALLAAALRKRTVRFLKGRED